MNVSTLIKQLQKIQEENGDLEVFFPNHDGVFLATSARKRVSEGEYPDDYNMPEGYEYIMINS